jgi:hypothetical protein
VSNHRSPSPRMHPIARGSLRQPISTSTPAYFLTGQGPRNRTAPSSPLNTLTAPAPLTSPPWRGSTLTTRSAYTVPERERAAPRPKRFTYSDDLGMSLLDILAATELPLPPLPVDGSSDELDALERDLDEVTQASHRPGAAPLVLRRWDSTPTKIALPPPGTPPSPCLSPVSSLSESGVD